MNVEALTQTCRDALLFPRLDRSLEREEDRNTGRVAWLIWWHWKQYRAHLGSTWDPEAGMLYEFEIYHSGLHSPQSSLSQRNKQQKPMQQTHLGFPQGLHEHTSMYKCMCTLCAYYMLICSRYVTAGMYSSTSHHQMGDKGPWFIVAAFTIHCYLFWWNPNTGGIHL